MPSCPLDWFICVGKRYGQEEPIAPRPHPSAPSQHLSSFKEAFIAWEMQFGGYEALVSRAWSCWSTIETWTQTHFEPVYQSLAVGASEEQLDEAEKALDVVFPRAMRIIYRVHDGQDLSIDRGPDRASIHPYWHLKTTCSSRRAITIRQSFGYYLGEIP